MTEKDIREFFYGDVSPQQREAVEQWMIDNIESEELDRILQRLLNECEPMERGNLPEVFDDMCRRNGIHQPKYKKVSRRTWLYAVAAVLVCVVAFSAYNLGRRHVSDGLRWVEVQAVNETKSVVLPDSTTIMLKPSSVMYYEASMFAENREVYLSGEAYAEVTKDPRHPFRIQSDGISVEVLGTKFNVQSYRCDTEAEVMLYEGAVRVSSDFAGKRDTVVLSPGNMLKIDKTTGVQTRYPLASMKRAEKDELFFIDKRLSDIVNQLERRFGKEIVIRNRQLADMKYYAIFANHESLDRILDNLGSSGRMTINYLDSCTIEIK